MTERKILWTVTDPRGLSISLAENVWQIHIAKRRDLIGHLNLVRLCVQDPDEIYFDPISSTKKSAGTKSYFYYKHAILPDKFSGNLVEASVKVVVEPDNIARGYVQSVIFPNKVRRRGVLEWKR